MTTFWLIWVACGVVAYGLAKGNWRSIFERLDYVGYGGVEESLCWMNGTFGIFGLVSAILTFILVSRRLRFCYRMPKELCKGYGERS